MDHLDKERQFATVVRMGVTDYDPVNVVRIQSATEKGRCHAPAAIDNRVATADRQGIPGRRPVGLRHPGR